MTAALSHPPDWPGGDPHSDDDTAGDETNAGRIAELLAQFAELRRRHGLPECTRHRDQFDQAEKAVEAITTLGVSSNNIRVEYAGRTVAVAGPITAVQSWCIRCPFRDLCRQLMTDTEPPYTGIAGGDILHKSRPYRPRRGRMKWPTRPGPGAP